MEKSLTVEQRALLTGGTSNDAIYRMAARAITAQQHTGGTLVDVGCGTGTLWHYLSSYFGAYVGADVVRYEGFPEGATFCQVRPETGDVDLPDGSGDVVACIETIEHVENPRGLVRELVRLVKPGGLILVSTPNQISLLSKLGLLLKDQFPAFQERPGLYPAHISALLPIDLLRIAQECGLRDPVVNYSDSGRIPGTAWHWPRPFIGRRFSDNVLLVARRSDRMPAGR